VAILGVPKEVGPDVGRLHHEPGGLALGLGREAELGAIVSLPEEAAAAAFGSLTADGDAGPHVGVDVRARGDLFRIALAVASGRDERSERQHRALPLGHVHLFPHAGTFVSGPKLLRIVSGPQRDEVGGARLPAYAEPFRAPEPRETARAGDSFRRAHR